MNVDERTMMAMVMFMADPRPSWASDEPHEAGCRGNEWVITHSDYQPATSDNGQIRDCYSFRSEVQPCTCGRRPPATG